MSDTGTRLDDVAVILVARREHVLGAEIVGAIFLNAEVADYDTQISLVVAEHRVVGVVDG